MKNLLLTIAELGVEMTVRKNENSVIVSLSKRTKEDHGNFSVLNEQKSYDINLLKITPDDISENVITKELTSIVKSKFL